MFRNLFLSTLIVLLAVITAHAWDCEEEYSVDAQNRSFIAISRDHNISKDNRDFLEGLITEDSNYRLIKIRFSRNINPIDTSKCDWPSSSYAFKWEQIGDPEVFYMFALSNMYFMYGPKEETFINSSLIKQTTTLYILGYFPPGEWTFRYAAYDLMELSQIGLGPEALFEGEDVLIDYDDVHYSIPEPPPPPSHMVRLANQEVWRDWLPEYHSASDPQVLSLQFNITSDVPGQGYYARVRLKPSWLPGRWTNDAQFLENGEAPKLVKPDGAPPIVNNLSWYNSLDEGKSDLKLESLDGQLNTKWDLSMGYNGYTVGDSTFQWGYFYGSYNDGLLYDGDVITVDVSCYDYAAKGILSLELRTDPPPYMNFLPTMIYEREIDGQLSMALPIPRDEDHKIVFLKEAESAKDSVFLQFGDNIGDFWEEQFVDGNDPRQIKYGNFQDPNNQRIYQNIFMLDAWNDDSWVHQEMFPNMFNPTWNNKSWLDNEFSFVPLYSAKRFNKVKRSGDGLLNLEKYRSICGLYGYSDDRNIRLKPSHRNIVFALYDDKRTHLTTDWHPYLDSLYIPGFNITVIKTNKVLSNMQGIYLINNEKERYYNIEGFNVDNHGSLKFLRKSDPALSKRIGTRVINKVNGEIHVDISECALFWAEIIPDVILLGNMTDMQWLNEAYPYGEVFHYQSPTSQKIVRKPTHNGYLRIYPNQIAYELYLSDPINYSWPPNPSSPNYINYRNKVFSLFKTSLNHEMGHFASMFHNPILSQSIYTSIMDRFALMQVTSVNPLIFNINNYRDFDSKDYRTCQIGGEPMIIVVP